MNSKIRLSICIATFGRGAFIGETLATILPQAGPEVEVIVVDGASPDETPKVLQDLVARNSRLVYRRETENAGVDRDFDKAVGYARGEWCWLLSDDDLLVPDAIVEVKKRLDADPDLVVVNARVEDKSLRRVIKERQMALVEDRFFERSDDAEFFAIATSYLSFIGAVVIRRSAWLARERERHYGSLFIHVGVIHSGPPLRGVLLLARPLIRIRYGNALWTARGFEIWTMLWPRMVWSVGAFGDAPRRAVTPRHPARSAKSLLWYRAIGALTPEALARANPAPRHALSGAISRLPMRVVNALLAVYCRVRGGPDTGMQLYDLARAPGASRIAQKLGGP